MRGVLFTQTGLSQQEVVKAFVDELKGVVDKAISVTGNASFVYHPQIKSYRLTVKNSTVSIFDKVSKRTASFTKTDVDFLSLEIEDSETIYVVKVENKVYILGKCGEEGEKCYASIMCCQGSSYCWGSTLVCHKNCAGNGEYASDNQACCSGFLNTTNGKCDTPPVCPTERVCNNAPESTVIGGKDCCPVDEPMCSAKHCCPTDRPKWCSKPVSGEPRCMSDADNKDSSKCKPANIYHLVFVPIGYGSDFDSFNNDAEKSFEAFLERIPLKDCLDEKDRIEVHIIKPGQTPECQISGCNYICSDCNSKALACANSIPELRGIINKVAALCKGNSCPGACGCANGIPGSASSINMAPCRGVLYEIPSHEIGHTMGLGHISCDVGCDACPYNCNCPDCSLPIDEKILDVMDYCYPMARYGPTGYKCLKEGEFKNYMC